MNATKRAVLPVTLLLFGLAAMPAQAQFREEFNVPTTAFRQNGLPGWNAVVGDGQGVFTQKIENGAVHLRLDARPDQRNIWYAFIHRDVAPALPLADLSKPNHGLRISVRVQPSHGPRRVNLYLKSLATGQDFLREFDLADANRWYDLSMTTDSFRHEPGKPLLAQVSFMDWGNTGVYGLEVDYLRVDVVDRGRAGPDQGLPLIYRPPVADASQFSHEIKVAAAVTVDKSYPAQNLSEWVADDQPAATRLMVDQTKVVLLRWDLPALRGKRVAGSGQLEFFTESLHRLARNPKDFGEVRVCEIIGGQPDWAAASLTYASLLNGKPEATVINEQTIIDVPVAAGRGGKTTVTLSQPVLQRLLDGRSRGLAIKPLGLVSAALADARLENGRYAVRIRLNVE